MSIEQLFIFLLKNNLLKCFMQGFELELSTGCPNKHNKLSDDFDIVFVNDFLNLVW